MKLHELKKITENITGSSAELGKAPEAALGVIDTRGNSTVLNSTQACSKCNFPIDSLDHKKCCGE